MDHREYLSKRLSAGLEGRRAVFEEAKKLENEDRECFSRAREGWEVIDRADLSSHPHKSLIPLYDNTEKGCVDVRTMSIDPPLPGQDADRDARAFVLNKKERDSLTGQLAVVPTLEEFKTTFLTVFCEGQLAHLNWNNVFAAGGGVLACAQPVPREHSETLSAKRNYFHQLQYASSDVDLFLYGLNEDEAKQKLEEIYKAVSEACPHTVVCFRSAHAVTLVSQYPFRHIQIVLRLYSSPYEILAGFDVDACTIGFDGKNVYADVRAHHALVTRKNTIDVSRRSPSYEMRLAKYGVRGFEVEVPGLKRNCVDPSIFERPWNSLDGLAKLLVLERLRTPEQRSRFYEMQKLNRAGGDMAQPQDSFHHHSNRGSAKYDSLTQERIEEKLGGTAEVSNYSTVFLAWGPDENAEKTMRLMASKDFKLNNKWFSRGRAYRLHPCFFGTMAEVLEDCSPDDPPFPARTESEDAKLREHRETYVRSKLTFIADDPGRQRIGSFHPLSESGWAEGVYFHESTEELFSATNANDAMRVKAALEFCTKGPDVRDFFGRTALHLALMAGAHNALSALLDGGASPLEPMAGGRTPFHLCALYGADKEIVFKLRDAAEALLLKKLQKESAAVAVNVGAGNAAGEDSDFVLVGKDDAAMDVVGTSPAAGGGAAVLETKEYKKAQSVVRNAIRALDGDATMSALQIALLLGNLHTARALLECGAQFNTEDEANPIKYTNPILLLSDDLLDEGIKLFQDFGFKASLQNKQNLRNTLHDLCAHGDHVALEAVFRLDSNVLEALNQLDASSQLALHAAIMSGVPECAEILLKTKKCALVVTEEMCQEARAKRPTQYFQAHTQCMYSVVFANIFQLLFAAIPRESTEANKLALERWMKMALLLASHGVIDASAKIDSAQNFFNVPSFQFHTAYWTQHHGYDPTAPYPACLLSLKLSDLLSFWIGSTHRLIQTTSQPSSSSASTSPHFPTAVAQSTFFAVCQEIESKLVGHPAQSRIRAHRLQSQLTEFNQNDLLEGMDAEFKEYRRKLLARAEGKKKEYKDEAVKILDVLAKKFKANKTIVDFYRTFDPSTMYAPARAAMQARSQQQQPQQQFVQASNLFFERSEEEAEIRSFLLLSEKRFPVPADVSGVGKDCVEPWALAAMQRKLFELCARSYSDIALSMPNAVYGYSPLEWPLLHTRNDSHHYLYNQNVNNNGMLSAAKQELVAIMFAKCRQPGFTDFAALNALAERAPIASTDPDGCTALTMAILANNTELFIELVSLVKRHQFKPKKPKPSGPVSDRIDNFALMEEMEEMDSEEDVAMEQESEDDEDGEDGEEEENDVSAAAKAPAVLQPGESTTRPEQVFSLASRVYLDDFPLTEKVMAWRDAEVKRVGRAGVAHNMLYSNLMLHATPLQLAIILGNLDMVRILLEEAGKISPMLLRSIVGHGLATARRRLFGNSPQSSLQHDITNAFELAIAVDRVDILHLLLTEAGIGLPFTTGIESHFNVLGNGGAAWAFVVEEEQDDKNAESSAKKKKARANYTGLVSCLYGATKRKHEMQRDPRLGRISHLPNPEEGTLLHSAAKFGSVECYKALRVAPSQAATSPQSIFGALVHFLAQDKAKCVRKLIQKARERTPALFAASNFGCIAAATVEDDARVIMRSMIGGDETLGDGKNLTPLHSMVLHETLELFQGIIPSALIQRDYTEVSLADAIMFPKVSVTTLGNATEGGSPLSLACKFGLTKQVELLLKLGFNPNAVDAYNYGMNAFHLALHSKQWRCAKLVAAKMDANRLMEPNEYGITPLMTAAKSGTVQGLLAAMAACPGAKHELSAGSNELDADGFSSLHFASNARFSETLKQLIDWSLTQQQQGGRECALVKEEFTSARTPLETSVAALIKAEWVGPGLRLKRSKLVEKKAALQQEEEEEELVEPGKTEEERKLAKEEQTYVDKHGADSFATFALLREKTRGVKRIRAAFDDVRPARERRFEAIGSVEVGTDLERSRRDFAEVWQLDSPHIGTGQSHYIYVPTMGEIEDVKERTDRRLASQLLSSNNTNVMARIF